MISRSAYEFDPTGVPTGAHLPNLTFPQVFAAAVRRAPQAPAVFVPADPTDVTTSGRWRTWAQWREDAHALASGLQELGVGPGDVVALHLPNSWEFLTLHAAAALLGAVTFPLHIAYGGYELGLLLERARPKVLVVPRTHGGKDTGALGRTLVKALADPCVLLVAGPARDGGQTPPTAPPEYEVAELAAANRGRAPREVAVFGADPLTLIASSGTSSVRPKICIHTHGGQLGNAAAAAADGGARSNDTLLSGSPFTHLFGLLSIHLSLVVGGRQALLSGWDVDAFLATGARARASVAFAVPAQLRDVLARVAGGAPPVALREVRTGGAPVPAELVISIRDVLGAGVVVQWGMSEVGAGTFTRPGDPIETVTGTIGRPVTGAEAMIAGEDGSPLAPGEVGELRYRSPTMFRGYLGDPERTAEAVTREGWLRTGDLAAGTEDGNIAYRGRRTEFLNRGGLKFSAVEVENLLSELPELAQFAILARDDERLGQRAVLVAAVRPGARLSLETVITHLNGRGLAKYKWPEELLIVDELPTTPTGKIARVRLRELIDNPPVAEYVASQDAAR
jgi:acyl-CoA synthetase (AMP-forming)/AMP-acid ligase II